MVLSTTYGSKDRVAQYQAHETYWYKKCTHTHTSHHVFAHHLPGRPLLLPSTSLLLSTYPPPTLHLPSTSLALMVVYSLTLPLRCGPPCTCSRSQHPLMLVGAGQAGGARRLTAPVAPSAPVAHCTCGSLRAPATPPTAALRALCSFLCVVPAGFCSACMLTLLPSGFCSACMLALLPSGFCSCRPLHWKQRSRLPIQSVVRSLQLMVGTGFSLIFTLQGGRGGGGGMQLTIFTLERGVGGPAHCLQPGGGGQPTHVQPGGGGQPTYVPPERGRWEAGRTQVHSCDCMLMRWVERGGGEGWRGTGSYVVMTLLGEGPVVRARTARYLSRQPARHQG